MMSDSDLLVEAMEVGIDHFGEDEIRAFRSSGYGRIPQPGEVPVIIVVDVTYEFCGRARPGATTLSSSPKSAGDSAWYAIDKLKGLLPAARSAGVPVIYTMNERRTHPVEVGGWSRKTSPQSGPADLEIVAEIAPEEGDLVVRKTKPSAFFGTPLASWLTEIGADTVFVAGTTTSGCVRATVTDAFSHNLRTLVVTDSVFDRSRTSHEVNLFEMQQKYAGLVETEPLVHWLSKMNAPTNNG